MMHVLSFGNVFIKKGRWRMNELVARLGKAVKGMLRGFDRIVFKGTILPLAHEEGAMNFLSARRVLNRDYKRWMQGQSEWATDLIVEKPSDLNAVMDNLLRHGWITGNSTRVLRYLGRRVTAAGKPHGRSKGEVISGLLDYHEGLRIRHWVDHNSVKMYNEYNNLRVETTMNTPDMFRVYRRAQGQPDDVPKTLRPLRKGVADIALRAKVSDEINERFMAAVSTFEDHTPVRTLIAEHIIPRTKQGRRVRALDISGKDRELLIAVSDPLFTVSGITNAALREKLRRTPWGAGRTDKQLSARISRHLRLLRDHGLIRKIPNRRRYQLTHKGTQLTSVLNAMLAASTDQLMQIAA